MNAELPEDLTPMLRHLEAAYPNEGCGVILRRPDGGWQIRPMVNAYDRYHARDPERFPRTSRTAYLFEPKEWLAVSEELDATGSQLVCVFHSHGDVGAYFSDEDKAMAAPGGEPVLPEALYLVVAVNQGKAADARGYRWDSGEFREMRLWPLGAAR